MIQDESDLLLHYRGMQSVTVTDDLWNKSIEKFGKTTEYHNPGSFMKSPTFKNNAKEIKDEHLSQLMKFTEFKDRHNRISEKELIISQILFILDFNCLIKVLQIQISFEN